MKWKKIKLGEITNLRQGFAINAKSKHYISKEITDYPLLRIADMKDKKYEIFIDPSIPTRFLANKDDIIYTRTGNVGLVFKGQFGVVHNNCFTVNTSDQDKISQEFLFFALQSKKVFEMANILATGAAQPDLPHGAFNSIDIVFPVRAVQDKIVEILSNYDKSIENCHRRIALLEEASQRLYKEWFVDYRFPGYESVAIVDGMPEGWSKGVVGDLGKFVRGKNLLTAEAMGGNIPVIAGGLKPSCWHNQSNTKSPVITVSGSGANAGYTAIHNIEVWAADCSFIDASMTSNIYFIYCFLKSNEELLRSKQKGAAQPHVYAKDVNACEIIIPPVVLLERFHNLATDFFKQIGLLKEMIARLSTTRDKLLEKLMSGEIEINA